MKLLKAKIFVLIVFIVDNIQSELSPDGENVCLNTETYEEKVKVEVRKPKIIKKKKWCWNIKNGFSCERSTTKWENVMELRTVNRTRIVPKCCDGYKEEREQVTKCSPVCLKGCVYGKCAAPEICACFSGYYGSECQKACPEGLWGENCINKCECSNNGKCDKTTGVCDCERGWKGDRCESTCENGYYGYMCKMKCSCDDDFCNHITGECITTTPTPTPETSTTTTKLTSEFSKTTEVYTVEDTSSFSEKSTTEEIISVTVADGWTNEESATEVNSEQNSDPTPIVDVFSSETKTEETKTSTQVSEKETDFWNSFEKSTNDVYKEVINNISDTVTEPISSTMNDIISIEIRGSEQEIDKTETDNFINEKTGSSNKATVLKIFHFLPGLFVFSSVSFLTLISFAMWLINKNRSKTRKILAAAEKKEKIYQMEEKTNYTKNSFFLNDSCINNEAYLSDADLNRTTPVLETFKPVYKSLIPGEKEIR